MHNASSGFVLQSGGPDCSFPAVHSREERSFSHDVIVVGGGGGGVVVSTGGTVDSIPCPSPSPVFGGTTCCKLSSVAMLPPC